MKVVFKVASVLILVKAAVEAVATTGVTVLLATVVLAVVLVVARSLVPSF